MTPEEITKRANEIHKANAARAELEDTVKTYVRNRYRADSDWKVQFVREPSIESFNIEGDTVTVEAEAPACFRGCCGTDWHEFSFPLTDLIRPFDEIEVELATRDEQRSIDAAKEKAEKEAEHARQKELRERADLERLKEKYEEAT